MARVTRADWLAEAKQVLLEQGFAKLTLKNLLTRLDVSHGSFYHHFKNREALTKALLDDWRQQMTMDVLDSAAKISAVDERAETLMQIGRSFTDQAELEVAFRSQARLDPLVREYVEEVDRLRTQNCTNLAFAITQDKAQAEVLGKLAQALFVGGQQVMPAYSSDQMQQIYQQLMQLVIATTEK